MGTVAHDPVEQKQIKQAIANQAGTAATGKGLTAVAVANCTVAADGTSAGTQLNALLAALRTAGILAQ